MLIAEAEPKMDDDGLGLKTVLSNCDAKRDHNYRLGADNFTITTREYAVLCEALSTLESRSEVLEKALSNLVSLLLQTMEPIGPMRDRKDYPPELQTAIRVLRAEPGAPELAQVAMARAAGIEVVRAEHEPNAAEQERIETAGTTSETGLGQTKPASAAPEQTDEQRIKTALLALRCPDPERARPDAMQPDMTDYDRGLRDGRARGLAEGLEEAAKVCEIYFDDEDEWLTRQTREVANAIRAKIKP